MGKRNASEIAAMQFSGENLQLSDGEEQEGWRCQLADRAAHRSFLLCLGDGGRVDVGPDDDLVDVGPLQQG